ncbi:hypothetical protein ND433_10095 [Clostridioides difficile]|nr:hypothetical protein [Clostridioides difficile]
MKTKIKKSSIISLVIAFSMVFTAFTPIVSYADEVTSNDTILNGEEQSNGQTPDVEKPSDGQIPDGEKPSDGQIPDGEKSSDGQMPDGEKPLDEQTPEEEKPLEEEIVIEEMSLKQDIDKILDMTLSQINKIVYNFWEDEEDVKADEQSEINQVFTSEDSFISLWYDKKAKVKNSCLLKEIDGSDRPYHYLRFDDITKTLTFDYVIKGLVGASS